MILALLAGAVGIGLCIWLFGFKAPFKEAEGFSAFQRAMRHNATSTADKDNSHHDTPAN